MARRRKSGFWRRLADLSTAASFVLVVAFIAAYFGELGQTIHQGSFSVVDGDSLQLGTQKFRLEGIDAPEYRQTCERDNSKWNCGREAASFLRRLVRSGNVQCHGLGLDKYERTLARCMLADKDINSEMVRNGWAIAYGSYHREEREAKANGLGIWTGTFDRPQDWREYHGDASQQNLAYEGINSIGAKLRLWWSAILGRFDFS